MDNFTKLNENDIRYDRSFVILSAEKPEIAALKSIGSSIINNPILLCFKLITTANLILLGHFLYEGKVQYQLFMTFQIGVFILEFFGKCFIMGLLKYMFGTNNDLRILYKLYINMKTALIFVIPLIIIPFSICSYYMIDIIFEYTLEIHDKRLISDVYKKYLLFTPILYFFEILFLHNLRFLQAWNKTKKVFLYIIGYLTCHVTTSLLLYMFLDFGLFGITLSYGINSFIYFMYTDIKVYNFVKLDAKDYFYIIPNKYNFNWGIVTLLKQLSAYSLINLGEIFPNQFIFFVSLFIDKNQLIANIIYLNFFELITEIIRGFYYTIKKDICMKYQDTIERQKFVLFFSIFYSIISLTIFIILLLFKNILLNIYIYNGGNPILQKIAGNMKILYSLCILLMSIKFLLSGIVRGLEIAVSNIRRLIYMLICIGFCWLFCFGNEFGIYGLWISLLILDVLHVCENGLKTINNFPLGYAA